MYTFLIIYLLSILARSLNRNTQWLQFLNFLQTFKSLLWHRLLQWGSCICNRGSSCPNLNPSSSPHAPQNIRTVLCVYFKILSPVCVAASLKGFRLNVSLPKHFFFFFFFAFMRCLSHGPFVHSRKKKPSRHGGRTRTGCFLPPRWFEIAADTCSDAADINGSTNTLKKSQANTKRLRYYLQLRCLCLASFFFFSRRILFSV